MKQILILICILCSFLFYSCDECMKEDSPELSGPYFGQEPPGDTAALFAPDIVSNGMNNRDMAFTADGKEIYFSSSVGNNNYVSLLYCKETDGKWSKPEVVSFARDQRYMFFEPFITADGKKLYFSSDMPVEGEQPMEYPDLYVSERVNGQWTAPENLGPGVNTEEGEYFPSVTDDGTLYFTRDESATRLSFIYRSEFENGRYSEAEKMPVEINAGVSRYNAFVAPDESYIIIPIYGGKDSFGGTDYYISYRQSNGSWSVPKNLGSEINSKDSREYSPFVSRDGKYFFFMSARTPERGKGSMTYAKLDSLHNSPQNGNTDIYWISTRFIDVLKAARKTD
ncbi:MAG: hypothetical protein K9G67_02060 [Bacteroidales bacterium]|nr:hypothetical protein [Bacteroidales bacterium]MCF8344644.1 hypothetical protein [Bacteroidales bacterium]MCF8349557.1 hypothetical protein [Bacteroidales bacterium]MCF8375116.1 hypothetical protein [Bacteroidales bacterium]MCF8400023.1 hypothetical protein [Bacteroidales bacterium]